MIDGHGWPVNPKPPPDWHWHTWRELLVEAYRIATGSPDPSSQAGAILFAQDGNVISQANNRFPEGLDVTPEMLERPLKYTYIEHAERNAIYWAVGSGKKPYLLVAPWAACAECARAIVQCGIRVLVRHKQASDRSPERWIESIRIADSILEQGGVRIIDVDEPNLGAPTIRHNGELWTP